VLITEKLKSYSAAKREILPGVEHRHEIQQRYQVWGKIRGMRMAA
jgi:hypothetical protein